MSDSCYISPRALLLRRNFVAVETKLDFKSTDEVLMFSLSLALNHTSIFVRNVNVTSTGPCQSEVIACIYLKRKECLL